MRGADEHSGRPAPRACSPDSDIFGADQSKSVTNSIRSWRELTVRETLSNATENDGEVLRSRADEDLGERSIRFHKARVHGHPWKSHDGIYERRVCTVKARYDVHEGLEPLAKLRDRRWRIKGRFLDFLDIELVNKHTVRLVIPLLMTESVRPWINKRNSGRRGRDAREFFVPGRYSRRQGTCPSEDVLPA